MNEYAPIVLLQPYGQIEVHLRELIDDLGLTRNALAELVHTRFEVIDRLYKGNVQKLDLDIAARICFVLKCELSDWLYFVE